MTEPAANYFLPSGYVSRTAPNYFDDSETNLLWQPDVYPDAALIARRLGCRRIIDVGCGGGRKLVALHPEFEITGVDMGSNIEHCRKTHSVGQWVEHNLESPEPFPLGAQELEGSVIVCADVIEHLLRPERLVNKLRTALRHARALVLSTPERVLTWGNDQNGPPPNQCHIREWALQEFESFVRAEGLPNVRVGLTRSNEIDELLRTIEALAFRTELDAKLATSRWVRT